MPETPVDADDADWDQAWAQALQINVVEPANLLREAVRHYRGTGGGIIITMSSWVAQQGSSIPQLTAYASTKAAIKAMTPDGGRARTQRRVCSPTLSRPGL